MMTQYKDMIELHTDVDVMLIINRWMNDIR